MGKEKEDVTEQQFTAGLVWLPDGRSVAFKDCPATLCWPLITESERANSRAVAASDPN